MTGRRDGWVDAVRASAILLMLVFHFCYDLRYFGYVDWQVPNGSGWWQFRYLILTLFLATVGASLSLAHERGTRWRSFLKRAGQIGLAALGITLVSLYLFPQGWIYFGILHFIFVASFVGLVLVARPRVAFWAGLSIVVLYGLGVLSGRWPFAYISAWLPGYTEDYVPFFPWLGVVFLGIWAGWMLRNHWHIPGLTLPRWIDWPARHALLVYLAHQPLFFAGFMLLGKYP